MNSRIRYNMYIYLKGKIPNVFFQCMEFYILSDLVYRLLHTLHKISVSPESVYGTPYTPYGLRRLWMSFEN